MAYDTQDTTQQIHSSENPVDADALYRAEQGWLHFIKYSKWTVLHVIAILILMAIFLI